MIDVDLSWNECTESNCNIFPFKDKFQEQRKHILGNSGSHHTVQEKAFCPAYHSDRELPSIRNFVLFKVLVSNIGGFFPSSKNMATHEELESVRWRIHLSHIITGLSKLDQSEGIVLL